MDLFHDFRLALRGFARRPLLCLGIVATLAVGLGANTAIFAFFAGAFWLRVPTPDPERLFWTRFTWQDQSTWLMSYQDWTEYRRDLEGLGRLVAEASFSVVLGLPGQGTTSETTAYGFGSAVSEDFFSLFPPRGKLLGRTFAEEEHDVGSPAVVVLDHGFWQRRLSGDPSILGRAVLLNGKAFTVVGVAPPGYQASGLVYQVYVPLERLDDVSSPPFPLRSPAMDRLVPYFALAPGVSQTAATARMAATARELDTANPLHLGERRVGLLSVLNNSATFETEDAALTGAVGCLLLLACANVANLLLARAVGRQREIAVQAALGAGPGRVARRLLIESVLLALAGGAAGLGVARALLALFERILHTQPLGLGVWGQGTDWIRMDERSVVFVLGLSLVTGVLFGLAPVLSASRCDLVQALKSGARDHGGRRFGARQLLVMTQVTLSTVLLLGAALLVRSFDSLSRRDPGYETERQLLTVVAVNPPHDADAETRARVRRELYELARRRLEAVPGVTSVALTSEAPGSSVPRSTRLVLPEKPDAELTVERMQVGPGFFDTLDVAILHGRAIDERDVTGGSGAVVVSEAFVKRHWPGEEPLGRGLRLPDLGSDTESDRFTVVGVAADIAHVSRLRKPQPAVYLPVAQYLWGTRMTVVVRTAGDPRSVLPAVRGLLQSAHPDLALVELATYDRQIAVELGDQRLYSMLASLFGLFGLVLACVGVYSVMNVSVSYRLRELGIRMALGATARDVVRQVLGETFVLVGLGIAVGVVGALGLGRYLESALHGVSPYEPRIFVVVPVCLALLGLVSAWLPAWRAGRVDPKHALSEQ